MKRKSYSYLFDLWETYKNLNKMQVIKIGVKGGAKDECGPILKKRKRQIYRSSCSAPFCGEKGRREETYWFRASASGEVIDWKKITAQYVLVYFILFKSLAFVTTNPL